MPHQCVRCSKIYEDGAKEILTGCTCGGRFFFFMNQKSLNQVSKFTENLTDQDKEQIEQDAMDLIGDQQGKDKDVPIVLDMESIRMLKPGSFEIDLVDLFRGKPLVYKLSEGKYVIDIASTFASEETEDPNQEE